MSDAELAMLILSGIRLRLWLPFDKVNEPESNFDRSPRSRAKDRTIDEQASALAAMATELEALKPQLASVQPGPSSARHWPGAAAAAR
ncbi:hypothetical protein NUW54_g8125 [Trametes sanguinea]|uniref:Uncharacterized protein n=1 Tax=Trametes sanguinea TaxID=158606 RepID=A0ACC1PFL0_9APHY|nr:hypothetical protein NUW54_g8125 [Trametes sanguinea]